MIVVLYLYPLIREEKQIMIMSRKDLLQILPKQRFLHAHASGKVVDDIAAIIADKKTVGRDFHRCAPVLDFNYKHSVRCNHDRIVLSLGILVLQLDVVEDADALIEGKEFQRFPCNTLAAHSLDETAD